MVGESESNKFLGRQERTGKDSLGKLGVHISSSSKKSVFAMFIVWAIDFVFLVIIRDILRYDGPFVGDDLSGVFHGCASSEGGVTGVEQGLTGLLPMTGTHGNLEPLQGHQTLDAIGHGDVEEDSLTHAGYGLPDEGHLAGHQRGEAVEGGGGEVCTGIVAFELLNAFLEVLDGAVSACFHFC